MSEYRLKMVVIAPTESVWPKISGRREGSLWVQECGHNFLTFCHNARVWQTDGQKGLGNTVRCITCSRTVINTARVSELNGPETTGTVSSNAYWLQWVLRTRRSTPDLQCQIVQHLLQHDSDICHRSEYDIESYWKVAVVFQERYGHRGSSEPASVNITDLTMPTDLPEADLDPHSSTKSAWPACWLETGVGAYFDTFCSGEAFSNRCPSPRTTPPLASTFGT